MAKSKIVDEQEAKRWMEEGRPYSWMIEEYRRKYNIETTNSMWGNRRRSWGFEVRASRDDELIPWEVRREHRWAYPLSMLRVVARQRRGDAVRPLDSQRLASWLEKVRERDLVVHYDPETEEGFFLVPRRVGIDADLIRVPPVKDSRIWDV